MGKDTKIRIFILFGEMVKENNRARLYWTLDVSRTASYEITLVRLSICPSLNFLKIGSLDFTDTVDDDS